MLCFRDWYKNEPWKANKDEILSFWKNLPGNIPIQTFKPLPPKYKGSTYPYDGVRVTGSGQFINAIASRLKDLIGYEGENNKLGLLYRQQIDKNSEPIPNSFVFYAQIKDKEKSQEGT